MHSITQPLREEHAGLLPQVEQLRTAADAIGQCGPEEKRRAVAKAHEFLAHHLIPHAEAEDTALYPVVGRIMGAPDATMTMRRDHVEVARLTAELGSLRAALEQAKETPHLDQELRRVLYGLYALVSVHFAKEEEIYLPMLDANLSEDEAARLFRDMETVASAASGHATN